MPPRADFVFFGPLHWAIMAAIPLAAAILARLPRPDITRKVFGWALAVNEVIWYAWRLNQEGFRFPEALPLQLCDLVLWITVVALLTLHPWATGPAWFIGIAGTAMAVVTPELWAPTCSYPTIYFFLAHGGVIAAQLFLAWSKQARPDVKAWWRALLVGNIWAALVGAFNAVFKTNYMFLCHKPASASALDFLGPWPWYILGGEALAACLFLLLLPFLRKPKETRI
jgi:hypothetical integral membrane protein (TIGR02206 family)